MCRCFPQTQKTQKSARDEFVAAGVVFTNGTHILAGYQPNKKKPCISGIGGMKEDGETYYETALRETFEELFELYDVPDTLIHKIRETLQPLDIIFTEDYVNIIFTFTDLETLLDLMKLYSMKSDLYDDIPNNLHDFIFKRKRLNTKMEISHLCILPLVNHDISVPFIDPNFQSDLANIQRLW